MSIMRGSKAFAAERQSEALAALTNGLNDRIGGERFSDLNGPLEQAEDFAFDQRPLAEIFEALREAAERANENDGDQEDDSGDETEGLSYFGDIREAVSAHTLLDWLDHTVQFVFGEHIEAHVAPKGAAPQDASAQEAAAAHSGADDAPAETADDGPEAGSPLLQLLAESPLGQYLGDDAFDVDFSAVSAGGASGVQLGDVLDSLFNSHALFDVIEDFFMDVASATADDDAPNAEQVGELFDAAREKLFFLDEDYVA